MNQPQNYIGSLAPALDHFFGNTAIQAAEIYTVNGWLPNSLEESKDRAISLLEKQIAKDIPEYEGVTKQAVIDLLKIAKGNWRDLNILKQMYVLYYEIIGKEPSSSVLNALNQGIRNDCI